MQWTLHGKQIANSDQLCELVAEQSGGVALLSFSCGKDSIGAYIQMKRHFSRIIPVYMYLVPGLSFVEKALAYYEDIMGTHIYRMPHPSLYRWLNSATYQAPDNLRVILEARLWSFDYDTVLELVKLHEGLDLNTVYSGTGVRAVDSPQRWSAIKQYSPLSQKRMAFYPIYDWRKARLVAEIRESGIKLPEEYQLFGRSFDGLDYRFMAPMKEHYPQDYTKVLQFFPLAELSLMRMEYRRDFYNGK